MYGDQQVAQLRDGATDGEAAFYDALDRGDLEEGWRLVLHHAPVAAGPAPAEKRARVLH